MEYVPLRFKEKKERLVFTGGGIGVSVAALSCICGNGKCGSVTDSDMDGGADPGSVSGKNVGYGENVLEDRLRIDCSTGPGDYRKTGWRSRVDAFVPDLRGWYLPETMAISGDRNSGSCHGIPHLYDVEHWLFDGSFAESGLEYTSIMEQGYSIGGLFSTYFYRNGHPGMGILLLGCLLFLLYQSFVKGKKICAKNDHIWLGAAALLTVMSLRYFPWDFVQRMGSWALGLVTLIGTPAVFFGYVQILLCVWSIEKCGAVLRLTDRTARMREGTVKKNGEK